MGTVLEGNLQVVIEKRIRSFIDRGNVDCHSVAFYLQEVQVVSAESKIFCLLVSHIVLELVWV